jgi:hypothetical protein
MLVLVTGSRETKLLIAFTFTPVPSFLVWDFDWKNLTLLGRSGIVDGVGGESGILKWAFEYSADKSVISSAQSLGSGARGAFGIPHYFSFLVHLGTSTTDRGLAPPAFRDRCCCVRVTRDATAISTSESAANCGWLVQTIPAIKAGRSSCGRIGCYKGGSRDGQSVRNGITSTNRFIRATHRCTGVGPQTDVGTDTRNSGQHGRAGSSSSG